MRQHIKSIGKESTIYSFSNILTRAIGFILIPLYTRYLTTEQYGIISIVASLISFIAIFYNFGMSATWSRFYFDFKDHSKEQKVFLGNILIFVVAIGLVISAVLSFFGKSIFSYLAPGVDFYPFILLAIWSSFFLNFFNIQLEIYRVRGMSFRYAGYSISKFIGTVVLTVIAIAVYKYGAIGKVVSEFVVIILTALFAFYMLASDIKIDFQPKLIKKAILFSFPLFLHQISSLIYVISDKFFLANLKGLDYTGIYNIGFQFGSIMSLIVGSIQLSWYTFFMKNVTENGDGAKPLISRLTTYYIMSTLLIGMGIVFFSNEIIYIFTTKAYYPALKLIPIFVLAFFFQGLYYIEVTKLYYDKKSVKYLPVTSAISAIANITLNFVLVPKFGIMGAAFSSLFTMFILYISVRIFGQKAYNVPYESGRILKLFLIVFILTSIKYLIQPLSMNFAVLALFKIILLSAFPVYILYGKFLDKSEYNNFKDIVYKLYLRIKPN